LCNLAMRSLTPMLTVASSAARTDPGKDRSGPFSCSTGNKMNSNFQKLAIWVAILVLLAALFNLFNNPTQSRRGTEITYSEFLTAVHNGNISDATLAGTRIFGTMRDGGTSFTTYSPPDSTLVERLEKEGGTLRATRAAEEI